MKMYSYICSSHHQFNNISELTVVDLLAYDSASGFTGIWICVGGWGPHAYSWMLEESISSAPQPQASCIPIHTTEVESGCALPVNGGNSRIGDCFQTQDGIYAAIWKQWKQACNFAFHIKYMFFPWSMLTHPNFAPCPQAFIIWMIEMIDHFH